jgi:hypothetical protein
VKFVATYDRGHEEWFWVDAQVIRGGEMAGIIAKQRQQQGRLPEGNIRSIKQSG